VWGVKVEALFFWEEGEEKRRKERKAGRFVVEGRGSLLAIHPRSFLPFLRFSSPSSPQEKRFNLRGPTLKGFPSVVLCATSVFPVILLLIFLAESPQAIIRPR